MVLKWLEKVEVEGENGEKFREITPIKKC